MYVSLSRLTRIARCEAGKADARGLVGGLGFANLGAISLSVVKSLVKHIVDSRRRSQQT
jgi:hypothetical protein